MVAPLARSRRRGPPLSPPVGWFLPQPLWPLIKEPGRTALRGRRDEPVLLRFTNDNFMDEVLALLAGGRGAQLYDQAAQPETWSAEDSGFNPDGSDKPGTLKLFQPAHNRYYLVAAGLACRIPGVPDRTIDIPAGETAFFVLRRIHDGVEYGWSSGAPTAPAHALDRGPYELAEQKGWVALEAPDQRLLASEERFPLFPLSFQQDGTTRRLLVGLVPVSSRETFQGGDVFNLRPAPGAAGRDPRPIAWQQRVVLPLHSLALWYREYADEKGSSSPERRRAEHALAFALLDTMELLESQLKPVFDAIQANTLDGTDFGRAQPLVNILKSPIAMSGPDTTIAAVLRAVEGKRLFLEDELGPEQSIGAISGLQSIWKFQESASFRTWLNNNLNPNALPQDAVLQSAFSAALDPATYSPQPADFPEQPKLETGAGATYRIRMVYERPQCKMVDISRSTRPFQLAAFFDPDAPARPICIRMPTDTSVSGLRRYNRGVSIIISEQLQKQMSRIKGLQQLMDGDVGDEPQVSLGMICSFSIPIITIVALILLLIFVVLLNIIFFWLPLFRICFPIPVRSE